MGANSLPSVEQEPRALGRYTLLGKLGAGGMGVVYRARDASTGRIIALKQQICALSGENADVADALFQREFHTLSGLKHPRIIEVYDYGHDARGPYYTMELLSGKSLRELSPVPYREACRHVRDVASSLALLHARRLIHCDVSPNNVRLSDEGRAKLLDFGALATFGTREHVIGTPASVAPEAVQLMPLDQRADLYSLGALLYWTLTGTHAYPARKFTDLFEVWKRPITPPSSLARDAHDDRHGNALREGRRDRSGEWCLMKHEKAWAWAAFAVICVVWGTTYLAIRIALETIPPLLLTGARFVTAGLIMLAVALSISRSTNQPSGNAT